MVKKIYEPKLLSVLRHNKYDKKTWMSDVIAGIIVGIIALPLAIAFGIASGVTPQQGLITASVVTSSEARPVLSSSSWPASSTNTACRVLSSPPSWPESCSS